MGIEIVDVAIETTNMYANDSLHSVVIGGYDAKFTIRGFDGVMSTYISSYELKELDISKIKQIIVDKLKKIVAEEE